MPETGPRSTFPFISPDAFVSAADQAALRNLQRMPLLPLLIRKFNEHALDRIWYVHNTADSVRCSRRQFPTLFAMMREACSILHIPEPELYVRFSPNYNAFTGGVSRTFIVLHSSMLQDFSDEEILYVIGHEIGHIKCGHVLYMMMAQMLLPLLNAVGQATLGLGQLAGMGLVSGFYEWLRQAEFSCDRAGLLVCQDTRSSFSATMKMGGGSSRFDSEMDVDAFLDQSRNYSEVAGLEGISKALLFFLYNWHLDHPQVVFRAKNLDEWIKSGTYDRILSGDYPKAFGGSDQNETKGLKQCKSCRTWVSASKKICPQCSARL